MNESESISSDLLQIWRAGVEAVKPQRLIEDKLFFRGKQLVARSGGTNENTTQEYEIDCRDGQRLIVVGAGKASAAMAVAFEQSILPQLQELYPSLTVEGWINCPEGSFPAEHSGAIRCFEARPAGVNVPTSKAVEGTKRILDLVGSADENDTVICLLSGGGSALLTAPVAGITLEDKQHVAKIVAAAGGNIEQLNAIRRALSQVKAGGLARHCKARKLTTLVVSDVLGDCLSTIASGPTDQTSVATPQSALAALDELNLLQHSELQPVVNYLRNAADRFEHASVHERNANDTTAEVQHVILGSIRDAVLAAEKEAVSLGYTTETEFATECEPDVVTVSSRLSKSLSKMQTHSSKTCLISGGEPTVVLPDSPGRGGRNQQLALSLLAGFYETGSAESLPNLAFASGGTDGEDGPTEAAGAWFDSSIVAEAIERHLDPQPYLENANAYEFFHQLNALIQIGPTGTNVCDLRVAICNG